MRSLTITCHCNFQPLKIDFGPFARDERVDRIEHILGLLMESRCGYAWDYQKLEMPCFISLDNFVDYDLMPRGSGPSSSEAPVVPGRQKRGVEMVGI